MWGEKNSVINKLQKNKKISLSLSLYIYIYILYTCAQIIEFKTFFFLHLKKNMVNIEMFC